MNRPTTTANDMYTTGRNAVIRRLIIAATSSAVLTLSGTAFAQQRSQFGTADEAKAMLAKTVAALKADKAKTLDMIAKGGGGFVDCDLYPFCNNVSDGKVLPSPNPNAKQLFGTDGKKVKDLTGKAFGLEQYNAGQKPEGEITEVSYMFPKPGPDSTSVPKVSFITRIGDIYCGVGYYK